MFRENTVTMAGLVPGLSKNDEEHVSLTFPSPFSLRTAMLEYELRVREGVFPEASVNCVQQAL